MALLLGSTKLNANPNQKNMKFPSNGVELAGRLYLPSGGGTRGKPPVIVVTGAWTTVKEQMPHVYAQELAKRGYAAFTFDFSGWGKSSGENRFLEDPIAKSKDIKSAIAFLKTRKDIDPERIGGLGICASSGYMVKAYTETPDLKAIALVAPWLHNPSIAAEVYGGEESVNNLIATGEEARESFLANGKLSTITAASASDEKSLMYQAPYYTEPERGLIKAYDNRFNLASWKPWLTFDAISLAKDLRKSVFFVHSEDAVIPHGIKQFASIAGDRVQGVWLDGVTQFEFYDQPEPVRLASNAITAYFDQSFYPLAAIGNERQAVQDAITKMVNGIDKKDWEGGRSQFADAVFVDYSSMNGQAGAEVKADDLVSGWKNLLSKASTHHMLSNFEIEIKGGSAETQCHVYASHLAEGVEHWDIFGRYLHKLKKTDEGWKIVSMSLIVHGEKGNSEFLKQLNQ